MRLAQEAGVSVLAMLSPAELHDEILAAADIVHFHFWNGPQLREFLEADWPQMRSLLWCHTNCREPPHILAAICSIASTSRSRQPHRRSVSYRFAMRSSVWRWRLAARDFRA